MYSETFLPGSCPPSPGLAPCAILIWICSALARYSAVTPKRPDATCLIFDFRESPALSSTSLTKRPIPKRDSMVSPALIGAKRRRSSPPSPVLDLPPMRFIATASVAWASVEIEPSDIAPDEKRLTISAAGSTSSIGTGWQRLKRNSNRPRNVMCRFDWSLMMSAYSR